MVVVHRGDELPRLTSRVHHAQVDAVVPSAFLASEHSPNAVSNDRNLEHTEALHLRERHPHSGEAVLDHSIGLQLDPGASGPDDNPQAKRNRDDEQAEQSTGHVAEAHVIDALPPASEARTP